MRKGLTIINALTPGVPLPDHDPKPMEFFRKEHGTFTGFGCRESVGFSIMCDGTVKQWGEWDIT